jgi:hypothetical protein
MGLNKTYLSRDRISQLDNEQIEKIFNSDILFFADEWSQIFFHHYGQFKTKETVLSIMNVDKQV